MSRTARTLAFTSLALFVLAALAGWWLMGHLTPDGVHMTIDGETMQVSGLTGIWPVDAVVGLVAGSIALLVVLVVVPLALLIGLGAPLLVMALLLALGIAAVGLVAALALSPLLLLGLLIWWIARPRRVAPSTTIAP